MLLDAVLSDPAFVWLGPSWDKMRYFRREQGDRRVLPAGLRELT